MEADWKSVVLSCVSCKVPNSAGFDILPSCEKWIASSALQKCIRRRAVELGQRAAITFHRLDPLGLWRRLISIAFEDIGAADIAALIETVTAATSAAWRTKVGEEKALAYLVQRLAEAPKDRSADYLMSAARHHPSLAHMRQTCATSSIETRLNLLTDLTKSLPERAVAAWFLSGLDERYEKIVGRGDLRALEESYRALGASDQLCAATMAAARRTREPFNIMVPLVWLEIRRTGFSTVRDLPLPPSPVIDGLPLCALDEHTRAGKQAINRLVAEHAGLRACLQRFVRKPRWNSAAQHAAFYVDGSPVTPRLDWAQSVPLETLGTQADLASAEVPCEGVQPLLDAIRARLGRLNEIRRELWCSLRTASQYPI
jgi:hypothetical protein